MHGPRTIRSELPRAHSPEVPPGNPDMRPHFDSSATTPTGGAEAPPAGIRLTAPARLESQAESELYDARIAGGRDLPEQGRSDVQARVVELRVIQHIEEIGAQFRLQALAPERCNLGDCQVDVGARRSAKRVAAQ